MESNHRKSEPWGNKARPITGITSTALGGKIWWYTCKLFGMNSLKGGAMWYVDPLLGNDCEISNCVTAVPPLEAITRGLLKTQQAEKTKVCALVNCKVCELVKWL
jgi:hypothetical protein